MSIHQGNGPNPRDIRTCEKLSSCSKSQASFLLSPVTQWLRGYSSPSEHKTRKVCSQGLPQMAMLCSQNSVMRQYPNISNNRQTSYTIVCHHMTATLVTNTKRGVETVMQGVWAQSGLLLSKHRVLEKRLSTGSSMCLQECLSLGQCWGRSRWERLFQFLSSPHGWLKSIPLSIRVGPERPQGDVESNNFRQTVSYGAGKELEGREARLETGVSAPHTTVVCEYFFFLMP